MRTPDDKELLSACTRLIEQKLGWGSSDSWTDSYFQKLSEIILEATGVRLSGNTLKRIWGKIEFKGQQRISTKDALVQYLGYTDWLHFAGEWYRTQYPDQPTPEFKTPTTAPASPPVPKSRKKGRMGLVIALGLALVGGLLTWGILTDWGWSPQGESRMELISVRGNSPFSVRLRYHVPEDWVGKVKLRSTTDEYILTTADGEYTQMVGVPGENEYMLRWKDRKLDSLIVKVPSKGWHAQVHKGNLPRINDINREFPILLPDFDSLNDNRLHYTLPFLAKTRVDISQSFWLNLFRVGDFEVDGDNFEFETRFKNPINEGGIGCQESIFSLFGTKKLHEIGFVNPGCEKEAKIWLGNVRLSATEHDLHPFSSADLENWSVLRLTVQDKNVQVWLNGKALFRFTYNKAFGPISGLRMRFRGTGSVDYVRLKDAKNACDWDF